MNKRTAAIGVIIASAVLLMMASAVLTYDWEADEMHNIPFTPDSDGDLIPGSLNFELFETYGPVILVLAMLMFGAIIGGAYVAKEEEEDDSD